MRVFTEWQYVTKLAICQPQPAETIQRFLQDSIILYENNDTITYDDEIGSVDEYSSSPYQRNKKERKVRLKHQFF